MLALCFTGCQTGPDYYQKNGKWFYNEKEFVPADTRSFVSINDRFAKDDISGYFRGETIHGSNGSSFIALSKQYARDNAHVYFCDTYRKGAEYFSILHNEMLVIESADATSFRLIDNEYGVDTFSVFYNGKKFNVKHRQSFQLLENGYAKDKVTAYYHQSPIEESEGSSFKVLEGGYSIDAKHVFYSSLQPDSPEPQRLCFVLPMADPQTFRYIADGYAQDRSGIYFRDRKIADNDTSFHILKRGYAKNSQAVFYDGNIVEHADPLSFTLIEPFADSADGIDRHGVYLLGKKK
jgi:DKNYY family